MCSACPYSLNGVWWSTLVPGGDSWRGVAILVGANISSHFSDTVYSRN